MAYYDIGEVFQKIEEDMIASMMRNLKRHLATEKEEGINYAMWQAEQLAALNEFKRNNSSLFKGYFSTINDQIEEVLKKAHETGKMEQEIQILEAIREGWSTALKPSGKLQGAFFRINDRKLKALINSVNNDMKKAETAMLRRANDEYRKIIFNSQAYYNTGAGTLPQCVDMATKDFLSKGITCIEYANGARVGIDVYSRMAIRTASTRAYLLGESAKRDEWGVSTVIVNKRGVACPKCLRYVGRVFYDDVWGSAPIPSPEKYPRLSEAIAGGLYHPNCKDVHTTYFEGISTPPEPMTAAEKKEASRVYNLEQQQRYNERQIRKYKRLSDGSVDPENQLRYQKKLEAWQAEQRRFVKANGDVLKRRYENEKLLVSEFTNPLNASANTSKYSGDLLTNSSISGKISSASQVKVNMGTLADKNKLGDTHAQAIEDILSNAPDNVRRTWNKYADRLDVKNNHCKDAHCDWTRGIEIDIDEVSKGKKDIVGVTTDANGRAVIQWGEAKKPYYTAVHEFGHNISAWMDYDVSGRKYGSIASTYKSKQFFTNVLDSNGKKVGYTLTELLKKEGDDYFNAVLKALKDDSKAKGLPASKVRHYDAWMVIKKEILAEPLMSATDISDMWDGISNGACLAHYGHTGKDKQYWTKLPGGVGEEAFAEMFSATVMNPGSVALIKRYFPQSYKLFEEILEELG